MNNQEYKELLEEFKKKARETKVLRNYLERKDVKPMKYVVIEWIKAIILTVTLWYLATLMFGLGVYELVTGIKLAWVDESANAVGHAGMGIVLLMLTVSFIVHKLGDK